VDIWFDVAVPGAGLSPTLHTDGTPDATASPAAIHAGMLKTGGGVTISAEIQEKTSDNLAAPYEVTQLTAAMSVTGDMLQLANAALLLQIVPGTTTATDTGKTGVTIGNLSTPNYTVLLAVWAKKDPTKFMSAIMYNSYQKKGFDLKLNRKEDAAAEVEFGGLAVTSRAAGDTVGALWIGT
jgi:hypothetical protein